MSCFSRFLCSFGWAAQGIAATIRQERNFRFHLVALAYLCYFQHFYDLNQGELALLLLCAGLVFCCELLNTAIERTVDLMSPQRHPLAKLAKDAAAGAVLVSALFSTAVALLLLWEPLVLHQIWRYFFSQPARLVALCISMMAAVAFIFLWGKDSPSAGPDR